MKIKVVIFLFSFPCTVCLFGQGNNNFAKQNWTIHSPFEQKVFIENNEGQFDIKEKKGSKILFKTRIGDVNLFFTPKGIIFSHKEAEKQNENILTRKEPGERKPIKSKQFFEELQWIGADSTTHMIPEDEVSFYYTYSPDNKKTIISHAYNKIFYKNLYPGIDAEFTFSRDTDAIIVNFQINDSSNVNEIKFKVDDTLKRDIEINDQISLHSKSGSFSFGENNLVASQERSLHTLPRNSPNEFVLPLNKIHSVKGYSTGYSWVIPTGFTYTGPYTGAQLAYDLGYDIDGNIYVSGNDDSWQLEKYDSTGNLLWIFTTNYYYEGWAYYGAFATDKRTGTSYFGEAIDTLNGPGITKISSSGIVEGTTHLNINLINELWRMDINYCTNTIIIAGGGDENNYQAATLDTAINVLNIVDVLGTSEPKHDMVLLASDPWGPNCYMATSARNIGPATIYDNVLVKCPVPTLAPTTYINTDGYDFYELFSNNYVAHYAYSSFLQNAANGINGIAVNYSTVFLWDGSTITSINKNSGNIIAQKSINPTSYGTAYNQELVNWCGIDIDPCGNIYLGDHDSIIVLDTNFNYEGTLSIFHYSLQYVYDIRFALGNKVYSCGNDFISSYTLPQYNPALTKISSPACSGCNGAAFVSLSGCVNQGEYSWSNGNTGQFQTNLCAGTYTVYVDLNCTDVISDTINIPSSGNPSVNIPSATLKDVSCFKGNNGSAEAIASGGTPPYTYEWFPNAIFNNPDSNLTAGTYTIITTDSKGCANIDTVTISQPTQLSLSTSSNVSIIASQSATLTASASGGTPPYTYTWNGLDAGTSSTVSPLVNTIYTVIVTDSDGCEAVAYITVDVICGEVFVPDAFSPGDAIHNNILYVRCPCISQMDFMVFDRWGNKVFESQSLNQGWDGTYKSQPMNTGTYMWCLKATEFDGTNIEKKGNVTLVR